MKFSLGEFGFGGIGIEWWALLITLIVVVAIVAMIIVAVSFTQKDGERFHFETRDLTYAAICIATAYALSFFGLEMPYGGTITFISTLPIMIYCYYFGFRKSCIVCTVYMLLQFFQNPYIISPWSALFDYVIPYMSLVFAGIFSYKPNTAEGGKKSYSLANHIPFFIGSLIYVVVRYISHVLSGVLFFAEYKWDGWALWPYSLAYNSFVLIDYAIAMVAAVCLLISRSFNSFMSRSIDAKRAAQAKDQTHAGNK